MKLPYQLISMAAMLRDYIDPEEMVYLDREHEKLTDIADSLYAAVVTPDQFKDEYKKLYDDMGADYFDKVLDDMRAIDSQLTSDDKVDELWYDYEDRLNSGVTASSKVKDAKISASIELIDTIGYIKNANGKFDICVVETPYADMQLATYDPVEDEYDILETVKDLDDARKKAAVQFKTQPEFVMASNNPFYDKLSEKDKRFVKDTEKRMASGFSPDTFDVYNALLPYIGEYSSNTGWTGSCELKKVPDNTTVDGYKYYVIWSGEDDIDSFLWIDNDNPRINSVYTLMVIPAHGIPKFCDTEDAFNRVVQKVFGDGLTKLN